MSTINLCGCWCGDTWACVYHTWMRTKKSLLTFPCGRSLLGFSPRVFRSRGQRAAGICRHFLYPRHMVADVMCIIQCTYRRFEDAGWLDDHKTQAISTRLYFYRSGCVTRKHEQQGAKRALFGIEVLRIFAFCSYPRVRYFLNRYFRSWPGGIEERCA